MFGEGFTVCFPHLRILHLPLPLCERVLVSQIDSRKETHPKRRNQNNVDKQFAQNLSASCFIHKRGERPICTKNSEKDLQKQFSLVCVCVCVCVRARACACACVRAWVSVCISIYIYIYICVCVCAVFICTHFWGGFPSVD